MYPSPSNRPLPVSRVALWWLHPFWIVVVPLLAISLLAYLLPEADYRENWRTPKAFDSAAFGLCVAVAAAFSGGCLLASWINAGFSLHRRLPPGPRDARFGGRELKILFAVAFAVTILGYAIWFGSILRQGGLGMIASLLTGGKGTASDLRDASRDSIITGVTTLTQFGMGTALLGTYLGFTQGWRKVRLRMAMLLFMTTVRAVFLSERLALIEVVLPTAILMMRLVGFGRPGSVLRRLLIFAPFVAIAGLYTLFTFTEYFRSWSYAERSDQSLLEFSMLRLLGYYVTALNNGAIEWHEHGALAFPYSTMDWLWRFPVAGNSLRAILGGNHDPADTWKELLSAQGNIEFNNPSGIFPFFTDFGVPGGLLFFVMFGCVTGLIYCSYVRGSAVGLFLYSFLFVGLSEQMRAIYITTGRAFPTWLLLLFAVLFSWLGLRRERPLRKPAVPPVPLTTPDPTEGA